jgi:Ca2+-binding EF-hand superfamily protein
MTQAGRRDAFKFALAVLDQDDKGSFTTQEVETILRRLFPQMPAESMSEVIQS